MSWQGHGEEELRLRSLVGTLAAAESGRGAGPQPAAAFACALPSCRELWRQARSKKVRAAFPKYTVDMEEREDGAPAVVKVSFVNGKSATIEAQDKTLLDLFDVMQEYTAELEEADEMQEMEKN